jgi:hypothetical protein
MGVPIMARPRPTATTATPTGAPRRPAGNSTGSRSASGPQQARKRRASAPKVTTAKAKPNPFDDIARQVNADLEAKDRAAGRDDLTPALAKSVDQAKPKRAATKPAKPARPAKVQATGNGKLAFGGRPVSNPAKVAERVKQLGLRVRSDADVAAIAARLRATPDAVSAWLEARNRKPPAKANNSAKSKQGKPANVPTITLTHLWADKKPDWLYRCTLVTRYEVRPDGTVWSTLDQVLGADGKVLEDFWRLPLDYRPTQAVQGNGRKVVLKDRTIAGLQSWLSKQGLTTPESTSRSNDDAVTSTTAKQNPTIHPSGAE